ncbi:D-box splicing factor-binding site containing protein, putative [Babesia ovata]|uniref:D-box splicing factor-binding site containing protein, putative n=1 Tax=Babesia ovata TaxID=189622 RepID=A0A2H6KED0_9APIC|nr:D-box splicing factor-binding site containing protein, putative [Babesia ovata]GBE61345.1 D-box splicing factor-binding site containing protein, putative [Babesia ovata]
MKISFGLASSAAKPPDSGRVAKPAASKFFEAVPTTKQPVKRVKVTEMENGRLRTTQDSAGDDHTQESGAADGLCVIPCTNRLDDVPARTEEPQQITKRAPIEIKYGLNLILPAKTGLQKSTGTPQVVSGDAAADVENNNDANRINAVAQQPQGKCASEPSEVSPKSNVVGNVNEDKTNTAATQEAELHMAPEQAPTSIVPPATDADVAKLILADIEQKKLREKLFGTDLVEQAANTKPILLRGKDKKRQLQGDPEASEASDHEPAYEKVAVDQFGLAMLLGMGFDPKKNTNKPKEYKRRAYERAGLGADASMKQNMEALTDTRIMAKLKKDQMYHQSHSLHAGGTWVVPGLQVRIVQRDHANFGKKGIVTKMNGEVAVLDIGGLPVMVPAAYLETVVAQGATKCKVVRQIARHNEKFYVPIGTVVDVQTVTKTYAKVRFREQTFTVSLDDICDFQ